MSLERVTDEMKNGSAEKKKKKNTNWLKVVHSLSKKKKKMTPGKTREIIQSQECGTDTPG